MLIYWTVKAGADLSSKNPARIAPLHCACSSGNVVIIKELLSRMPKGELDVESGIHGTPIYAASFRGHLEVCIFLTDQNSSFKCLASLLYSPGVSSEQRTHETPFASH